MKSERETVSIYEEIVKKQCGLTALYETGSAQFYFQDGHWQYPYDIFPRNWSFWYAAVCGIYVHVLRVVILPTF